MPDVTVRLSVADNFSAQLREFADQIEGATGETTRLGEETRRSTNFQTELRSAIGNVRDALAVVKGAYDETVGSAVEYAKQVRDLSRAIGASAEESSKLIQAADDVGVSVGTLTQGLEAAIRQGLTPSVAGLGRLSDQYRAIQDPIERTKFLLDAFGRSGADLAPLMELGAAGIRELGDAAEETGLVLSDQEVKAAREYEIAIDNLSDSVHGLQVRIGNELIPTLTSVISSYNDNESAVDLLNSALKDGVISEEQWLEANRRAAISGAASVPIIEQLSEHYRVQGTLVQSTAQYISDWAASMGADVPAAAQTATEATLGLSDATTTLAGNIITLKGIQDGWGASTAGTLAQQLEAAGLKGLELDSALRAVDGAFGTSEASQKRYRDRMAEIIEQYQKTGDVYAFRQSLNDLKADFEPAAEEADKYYLSLARIHSELGALTQKTWQISVDYALSEHTLEAIPPTPPHQHGGPVGLGTSYLVGERGPELFVPNQSGTIVPNYALPDVAGGGGTVININAPLTIQASGGQAGAVDLLQQLKLAAVG